MGSELNPITVAALLARMITLQYPEYNFPGDVNVTEPERQLAKQLFKIVIDLVADAKDVEKETQKINQMQRAEKTGTETSFNIRKKDTPTPDVIKTKAPEATQCSNKDLRKIKEEKNEGDLRKSSSVSQIVSNDNSHGQNVSAVNVCADRTIKREVEEFHISNINLHENFPSQQKVLSSDRSSSSTRIISIEVTGGETSGATKISNSHSIRKDEKQNPIPSSLNSTKPEVSTLKVSAPKVSKRTAEISTPLQLDDPDIICLDDSDDDTERNGPNRYGSVDKEANFFAARQSYSMNSSLIDKSRLQEQNLKADAVKNAINMENFTLAEFSRMRHENRNVLGADLRRWATIRASTINDFEYQVGEEWVKYFVKKYNIIYNKNIHSLVFEREKLSSVAPKKRKTVNKNNKNRNWPN